MALKNIQLLRPSHLVLIRVVGKQASVSRTLNYLQPTMNEIRVELASASWRRSEFARLVGFGFRHYLCTRRAAAGDVCAVAEIENVSQVFQPLGRL